MPLLTRFGIPAIAAALAIAVTAPVVADHASARPVRPDWDRGDGRLREEITQLRTELGYYQQAYAELNAGLDRVDRANRRNRDRRSMFQIDRAIRDARDNAAQYVQPWTYDQQQPDWRDHDDWRRIRDRRTDPQPPSMPAPVAMNDRDFGSLTAQIARAPFADDKLGLVQTAAQTNFFTVAQVVAMMKLASFDDTRVEIAVACAPRVLDGDRWFEVYGALTFSTSRDALRDRIGTR